MTGARPGIATPQPGVTTRRAADDIADAAEVKSSPLPDDLGILLAPASAGEPVAGIDHRPADDPVVIAEQKIVNAADRAVRGFDVSSVEV
jgi:hypothetical protein